MSWIDKLDIIIIENDDDLLDFAELLRDNYMEYSKAPEKIKDYEDIALNVVIGSKGQNNTKILAKLGEKSVGYISGFKRGNTYVSRGVYTVPKMRRLGVSSSLKKAQINQAKKEKCDEIITKVEESNLASKRLQEKFGFKYDRKRDCYVLPLNSIL